jgi:flavin reductase (DIM6/NTAB) family NADH-FMN oxidoreductase RutF
MDQLIKKEVIEPEIWRKAMSSFASGVTIIACLDARGQAQGMTVSAFCSLSLEPPLCLVCINPEAGTYPHILSSGYFSVNILHASQEELSNKFAMMAEEERFTNVATTPASSGSPFIGDSLVNIDCKLEEKISAGDHKILIGRPIEIKIADSKSLPLVYWNRDYQGIK